jgi:type IV pilus assembly protein PilO
MAISIDSVLKLSTAKKAMILAGILCALTALFLHTFFLPQREEVNTLRAELNKLAAESNQSQAIAKDLQKFKDQVGKLDGEFVNALTQLPNEKEIPEILKNISSLGKESNLEFILFRPKAEEAQQFYSKVPIELTMIGSYHNTGAFFDKLSKLPRIINVVDFNMTRAKDIKGKEGGDEVLVKTSCMVNTYRFTEKKGEDKKSEKKIEKKETPLEAEEGSSKAKKR